MRRLPFIWFCQVRVGSVMHQYHERTLKAAIKTRDELVSKRRGQACEWSIRKFVPAWSKDAAHRRGR